MRKTRPSPCCQTLVAGGACGPINPYSLGLTPEAQLGETDRLMGQQFNKVIKRRRRRAYLERVKARIKSARTASKKKTAKK